MSGTLFVVSTPIGNLEDVTLRALRVLREADLVAAEDTRRTSILLNHYQISTPTTSLHEHNERDKIRPLLARLGAGERIALVSDAGTPTVSDPGFRLVEAALEAGFRVEAVPGPSAVLAALVASGLPTDSFTFLGFVPSRSKARKIWLEHALREHRTVVCFESARRLSETLNAIKELDPDRKVAIGRELTKIHENLVVGPIEAVERHFRAPTKGEITLVLAPAPAEDSATQPISKSLIYREFYLLANNSGADRRQIIRELAKRHNLRTRDVYDAIEQQKNIGVTTK